LRKREGGKERRRIPIKRPGGAKKTGEKEKKWEDGNEDGHANFALVNKESGKEMAGATLDCIVRKELIKGINSKATRKFKSTGRVGQYAKYWFQYQG